MQRIADWLRKEPIGFWKTFRFILFSVVLAYVYNLAVGLIYISNADLENLGSGIVIPLWWIFLLGITIAPVLEELFFRLIPLCLVGEIFKRNLHHLLATAVVSSLAFAYVHNIFGGLDIGWMRILLQGVSGLILSLVFLKCGGMNRRYFKAYCASVITHTLFNAANFAPFIILGVTEVRV